MSPPKECPAQNLELIVDLAAASEHDCAATPRKERLGHHAPLSGQFGSTETRASLDALATRMLTAFLASPAASVQGRVLVVEEEISGMLVEGVPDLYGRVDLLTEDADRLVATDIKTSRSRWSPDQAEESAEQLLLYSKLASELAPGRRS